MLIMTYLLLNNEEEIETFEDGRAVNGIQLKGSTRPLPPAYYLP